MNAAVAIELDKPRLQGAGGWAALFVAVAYVVGFAAMATVLSPPAQEGARSPAEMLAFVLDRKLLFQLWMVFIYVAAGGALVVLSVGLHERLKQQSPDAMQIATPFGLIWAGLVIASGMVAISGLETVTSMHARDASLATTTWVSIDALQNGLGGGIEIVGGVWMLLVSAAALRTGAWAKALAIYGIAIGAVGVLTVIPLWKDLVAVFGLGQILRFGWVGGGMLRQARRAGSGPKAALARRS